MSFIFAGSAPHCGASLWITDMSATEWRAPSYERSLMSANFILGERSAT
jgi:hypothetical protein